MSLINEALKKAQRQRTDEPAEAAASEHAGGSRVAKRGKAPGPNAVVLIASGAVVLVVLSVFLTVYLVNRPSTPARVAASSPAPVSTRTTPAPVLIEPTAPAIVAPKILSEPPLPPITSPSLTTP